MAQPLDLSGLDRAGLNRIGLAEALRARIDYFRDLGVFEVYRRETSGAVFSLQASEADLQPEPSPAGAAPMVLPQPKPRNHAPDAIALPSPDSEAGHEASHEHEEDSQIAARKAPLLPIAFTPGPLIAPAARAGALDALQKEIGPDCTRCPLGFAGRHKVVFGDGDANARLLFVGEGPGADEDAQGLPFVGRAGQLLNNMIAAMGLSREQVYIANVVKCRPPKNRVPEQVEATTCSQFLFRQIEIVRPEVIVALGATAATYLLGGKSPLSALRGRVHAAHGAKLIVTYHPAYLLRDPTQKKAAWADLQIAMRELKTAG